MEIEVDRSAYKLPRNRAEKLRYKVIWKGLDQAWEKAADFASKIKN